MWKKIFNKKTYIFIGGVLFIPTLKLLSYPFRNRNKEVKPEKNKFYLVDPTEEGGVYGTLFGTSFDAYENLYNQIKEVPERDEISIVIKTRGGSWTWC